MRKMTTTTRRWPGLTSGAAGLAGLAVFLLSTAAGFAHTSLEATAPTPPARGFYVPYVGAGDPAGLTSPKRVLVAALDASVPTSPASTPALPYGGFGDPAGLTKPVLVADTSTDVPLGGLLLVDAVRAANARFTDVKVALAEGYAPIPCVSGIDGGAMGVHYVNGALIADAAEDIAKPEAVMYEPQADGSMELVAVEYITHQGPAELGGHLFAFNGAPNRYGLDPFYELHVWAWRDNPTGTYADMNPTVSCENAHEQAK
jgi:hypothetical protein